MNTDRRLEIVSEVDDLERRRPVGRGGCQRPSAVREAAWASTVRRGRRNRTPQPFCRTPDDSGHSARVSNSVRVVRSTRQNRQSPGWKLRWRPWPRRSASGGFRRRPCGFGRRPSRSLGTAGRDGSRRAARRRAVGRHRSGLPGSRCSAAAAGVLRRHRRRHRSHRHRLRRPLRRKASRRVDAASRASAATRSAGQPLLSGKGAETFVPPAPVGVRLLGGVFFLVSTLCLGINGQPPRPK